MTQRRTLHQLVVLRSDSVERERGFTLTEIMISMVILSVGLLGLASQTVSVIKANSLSDQMTRATVLAEDKIEQLKRLGYTDPQLTGGGDTTDTSFSFINDIAAHPEFFTSPDHSDEHPTGGVYTVALTTAPKRVWNVADNTPATGMKTISVVVGWTTSKSGAAPKSHYVALATIIHEYQ